MIPGAARYSRSTLGLGDERVDWNDPDAARRPGSMPVFEGHFWSSISVTAWEREYSRSMSRGGSISEDAAMAESAEIAYGRVMSAQAWHKAKSRSDGFTWSPYLSPSDGDRRIIEDIAFGGEASSSLLNAFRAFARPADYEPPPPPGQQIQYNQDRRIDEGSRLDLPSDTKIDLDAEPGDMIDEIKKWAQIAGLVLGGVLALWVMDKVLPVSD